MRTELPALGIAECRLRIRHFHSEFWLLNSFLSPCSSVLVVHVLAVRVGGGTPLVVPARTDGVLPATLVYSQECLLYETSLTLSVRPACKTARSTHSQAFASQTH